MTINRIDEFITLLRQPVGFGVFNPWDDWDKDNDIGPEAPAIRREHLRQYLSERRSAVCLAAAEALGYQGGRFTGIPMTSERILLDGMAHRGIRTTHILGGAVPRRTSRPAAKPQGFAEPTATVAWQEMIASDIDTRSLIFWNAYPWHPYEPASGPMSNRTPTREEVEGGKAVLRALLDRFEITRMVALGQKAYQQLTALGLDCVKVRHPARGGATEFRRSFVHAVLSGKS